MAGSHFTGPVYSSKGFYGPTYTYATLPAASSVNAGTTFWTTDKGWYTSNGTTTWTATTAPSAVTGYRAILLGDSLNANYIGNTPAVVSVIVSGGVATVTVAGGNNGAFAYPGDYIVMFNPGDPTSADEWSGKWIQVVDAPSTLSFRFATSKANGDYTYIAGNVWQYKTKTLTQGASIYAMLNAFLGGSMTMLANFAQGGTSSSVTVGLVPKILSSGPKFDLAFIQMGTNDINGNALTDATAKSTAATVIANYTTVCNQLLNAGVTPVIGILPFFSSPANRAISGVQITSTSGDFSCSATSISLGQAVTISGTNTGTGGITGYSSPTTYLVSATNGINTFKLTTLGGSAIVTTTGTPIGWTYLSPYPNQAVSIVRRGLREYAARNPRCIIIDHQENFGLGTDQNGASLSSPITQPDGIHILTSGYYYSAKQAVASGALGGNLKTLPTVGNTIWINDDGFTNPLTGAINLVQNPGFTGTGGTNLSGTALAGGSTIPDTWRISGNSLPATTGVTCASNTARIVSTNGNPNVVNLARSWQFQLLATAANQELDLWSASMQSIMVAGQWYRAGITVTAQSAWSNVKQFKVALFQNGTLSGLTLSTVGEQNTILPYYGSDYWPLTGTASTGDSVTLATDLFYIPPGTTWNNCFLRITVTFSAAGSANFQLSNPFCVGGYTSPYV